jgi:hypothetical protein
MANAPEAENVRVAVRVRPLSEAELTKRCRPVVHKSPSEPIIFLGDHHQFTFDEVPRGCACPCLPMLCCRTHGCTAT